MTDEAIQPPVNRREFIKAAAFAAVVATSAGASAALLVENNKRATPLPAIIRDIQLPSIGQNQPDAELVNQLTSFEVENASLRAQLRLAESKLEVAELRGSGREGEAAGALQSQLEQSSIENGALLEEVTLLTGLVALYEELEALDFDTILEDGISAVEGSLDDLLLQIPTVEEGIEAGQEAIAGFEAQIPALETGKHWLDTQFDSIGTHLDELETALKDALKSAGPIMLQLGKWFQDISKWLPFGIGNRAAVTMDALSTVLTDLVQTKEELPDQVAAPLAGLLDKKDNETAVQRNLINPLRQDLIGPTAAALDQTNSLGGTITAELIEPYGRAAQERKRIGELITSYREAQKI